MLPGLGFICLTLFTPDFRVCRVSLSEVYAVRPKPFPIRSTKGDVYVVCRSIQVQLKSFKPPMLKTYVEESGCHGIAMG